MKSSDADFWWKPRHNCLSYAIEKKQQAEPMLKSDFDAIVGQFSDGPFKESFGDGYGHPYNPNRQAFGQLTDGRVVFTELSGAAPPMPVASKPAKRKVRK